MAEWKLPIEKLKGYPHFDAFISAEQATKLVTNSTYVSKHGFLPLLGYKKTFRRFAKKGDKREPKPRDICYASRKDSYIFTYYRYILSELYEEELRKRALSQCVLAYRKIVPFGKKSGKCNIDFAKEAFDKIKKLGDCQAICLDIKSYFDSIDHQNLKKLWTFLLKDERLPKDHYKVFKAVTNYTVVDRTQLFSELNIYGPKMKFSPEDVRNGYLVPKRNIQTKICSGKAMRKAFSAIKKKEKRAYFKTNYKDYGIPQGIPLSDLLANINLINFDEYSNEVASRLGGYYYRYSDDILFILPVEYYQAISLMVSIDGEISKSGRMLKISTQKSSIFSFRKTKNGQTCLLLHGEKGGNGLEYLGFRFNGKNTLIKDGTLSNVYRKAVHCLKRECLAYARRYPDKDATELTELFDLHTFYQKFLTVEDYYAKQNNKRNWTFWSYAKRAASTMKDDRKGINKQLNKFHYFVCENLPKMMRKASKKREEILMSKRFYIHKKPLIVGRNERTVTSPTPA